MDQNEIWLNLGLKICYNVSHSWYALGAYIIWCKAPRAFWWLTSDSPIALQIFRHLHFDPFWAGWLCFNGFVLAVFSAKYCRFKAWRVWLQLQCRPCIFCFYRKYVRCYKQKFHCSERFFLHSREIIQNKWVEGEGIEAPTALGEPVPYAVIACIGDCIVLQKSSAT